MYYYSGTVSIDRSAADEWLEWMTQVHIPDVMATGLFSGHRVTRILEPEVDPNALTFNIQYAFDKVEQYETYCLNHAPALQLAHAERYGERFVAFRTLLQEVY